MKIDQWKLHKWPTYAGNYKKCDIYNGSNSEIEQYNSTDKTETLKPKQHNSKKSTTCIAIQNSSSMISNIDIVPLTSINNT